MELQQSPSSEPTFQKEDDQSSHGDIEEREGGQLPQRQDDLQRRKLEQDIDALTHRIWGMFELNCMKM